MTASGTTSGTELGTELGLRLRARTFELHGSDDDLAIAQLRAEHPMPEVAGQAGHVLEAIARAIRPDVTITTDVGQHQMWVAQHYTFNDPTEHLSSGGLGTMGYGLPAAIGAKIARPEHTVVCVSGDGSIMMNVQELATIKRYDIDVKILLLDNSALGLVRQWQEIFFDGNYSEVHLSDNPDFAGVARAFGLQAKSIKESDQVDEALEWLLNTEGAAMLHVSIDSMENVWPLVPPGKPNHKMMKSMPKNLRY